MNCEICGKEIKRTSNAQKYCKPCARKQKITYDRKFSREYMRKIRADEKKLLSKTKAYYQKQSNEFFNEIDFCYGINKIGTVTQKDLAIRGGRVIAAKRLERYKNVRKRKRK